MERINNCFIRVLPFPTRCGGMVMPNDDDTYSIYINANLPPERQLKALLHEIEHVTRNDFTDRPIKAAENLI